MLQCAADCCRVLYQRESAPLVRVCVAVCCGLLQCVADCCGVL